MGNLDVMIAAHALAAGAVLVTSDRAGARIKKLRVEEWAKATVTVPLIAKAARRLSFGKLDHSGSPSWNRFKPLTFGQRENCNQPVTLFQ
jgi:hypothetical protein